MVDILAFEQNKVAHLKVIEKLVKKLEELLESKNIRNTSEYNHWFNCFAQIYGTKLANLHLYILFGLIYFIGYLFIFKIVLSIKISTHFKIFSLEKFDKKREKIRIEYHRALFLQENYFDPFFQIFEESSQNDYKELLSYIEKDLFSLKIPNEYFFDFLIQTFLSNVIRHKSGEFYTPRFLTNKMVETTYRFGEMVLDLSCGSANFLIEIVKTILHANKPESEKFLAISRLYGYDINPISIFIAKVNFLLLLGENVSKIELNFFVKDSLFLGEIDHDKKFNLIIGNPPWYTLRDINSIEYQNKIKFLAEELKIKPSPKNVLNIEISTLFFYKAKEYLKKNSKIFFVMTKGIITGSHASRFRNFCGFKNIKIWKFDPKIEKVFNIDFICLYAEYSNSEVVNKELEIPVYYLSVKNNNKINYFDNIELILNREEIFIPYHVERKGDKAYVQKLVNKEEFQKLLPIKPSIYKKLFHKGADLNPRNLIFIRCINYNDSLVKINPEPKIFERAKPPWNIVEFEDEKVEKNYIFNVIKSTELIKFLIFDSYRVFLPLSKKDLSFTYDELSENAKNFYDKINQIYLKHKKVSTKNKSLMDNLNRWSKLINSRQQAKIKVVYNNSGSVLSSAVIEGDYLITGDLTFYNPSTIDEAYYLSAVLNSPLINNQVRIKKSSRHIFKLPFENPIRKFNFKNKNHTILSDLGKKGQFIAKNIYQNLIQTTQQIPSKARLQKLVSKELKPLLTEIDKVVEKEFQA
ncbi:MAG: class I SAM-dependent DNA methyltransferase [Candidatus Thorarchaeota archaeon]